LENFPGHNPRARHFEVNRGKLEEPTDCLNFFLVIPFLSNEPEKTQQITRKKKEILETAHTEAQTGTKKKITKPNDG
jgi:hypothetical protein